MAAPALPSFRRSEVVGFVAELGTTFTALPDLIALATNFFSVGAYLYYVRRER
jgi:hypothetical protein